MRHYALSAVGRDRPGIVAAVTEALLRHAVTAALAERGVDVTDMTTKLAGEEGEGEPLYALMMELALPADADAAELDGALAAVAREQGVDVSMRPLEPDTL